MKQCCRTTHYEISQILSTVQSGESNQRVAWTMHYARETVMLTKFNIWQVLIVERGEVRSRGRQYQPSSTPH